MTTAIWWIRRDMRLGDNQALTMAISHSNSVLPVFILDPVLLASSWVGEKRLAFMYEGLRSLDVSLRTRGSCLIVRTGNPSAILKSIIQETGAERIFAEADYSPYAMTRDLDLNRNLPINFLPGLTVHSPTEIFKADGKPYTVFTPFSKAWLSHPFPQKTIPAPEKISTPHGISSESIPDNASITRSLPFRAGESAAYARLETFKQNKIHMYSADRNRVDLEGTSGLSPYLRFGMLSARQVAIAARESEALAFDRESRHGAETWLNELIWREFYISILFHFPETRRAAFRSSMRNFPWINNPEEFNAWKNGQTGYPIVDAAMRQLSEIGWMHNRARMITASFLTKDLMIDWRWGEKHFMQQLIDGDPAANNGGWQWTAGSGTDAAPFFRIFNPVLQGMKFDPDGAYIRRYIPELAKVPTQFIHRPWEMDQSTQRAAQCRIGIDYPAPIIDHAAARERVLHAYQATVKV